jgi:hypothetical protein
MFKSKAEKKARADAAYNGNRRALQERATKLVACGCRNPANCTTCRGTGVRSA